MSLYLQHPNPKYRRIILKNAKLLKTPIIEIGHVVLGKGVFVQENDNEHSFERFRMETFQIIIRCEKNLVLHYL